MTLSSRFPVAVHILVALSYKSDGFVSSEALARSVSTNPVVVRRVIASLRSAGFVTSQSGVTGGARLARPASEITLLDVYHAVSPGGLFRIHEPNLGCPIGRGIPNVLGRILPGAETAMKDSLATFTVERVAHEVRRGFGGRSGSGAA